MTRLVRGANARCWMRRSGGRFRIATHSESFAVCIATQPTPPSDLVLENISLSGSSTDILNQTKRQESTGAELFLSVNINIGVGMFIGIDSTSTN